MDCVCVPFREWMGKTKDLSAFEQSMSVGARRTGLSVSRTATLLGSSKSTVSHVYQEWSTTKRTSSQLDTTVGNIGVNMRQHPCGMLSTPCEVHVPVNWGCSEGKMVLSYMVLRVLRVCSLDSFVGNQIYRLHTLLCSQCTDCITGLTCSRETTCGIWT